MQSSKPSVVESTYSLSVDVIPTSLKGKVTVTSKGLFTLRADKGIRFGRRFLSERPLILG